MLWLWPSKLLCFADETYNPFKEKQCFILTPWSPLFKHWYVHLKYSRLLLSYTLVSYRSKYKNVILVVKGIIFKRTHTSIEKRWLTSRSVLGLTFQVIHSGRCVHLHCKTRTEIFHVFSALGIRNQSIHGLGFYLLHGSYKSTKSIHWAEHLFNNKKKIKWIICTVQPMCTQKDMTKTNPNSIPRDENSHL